MRKQEVSLYDYILINDNINLKHLTEHKNESKFAKQLEVITDEERSEIIRQLFHNGKKYLRFNKSEKNEDKVIYTFSVLTPQLAEFDRAYFEKKLIVESEIIQLDESVNERVIDKLYKPYYCEAVIEISTAENEEMKLIIDKGISGKWTAIKIYNSPTNNSFPLKIHFSASPFDIESLYAEWETSIENKGMNEIQSVLRKYDNKIFDYSQHPSGSDVFNKLFQNIQFSKIHVLRVGEASANYCFADKHKYYFDVGLPLDQNFPEGEGFDFLRNSIEKGYFENGKAEVIILSHWHMDHVRGAFVMGSRVQEMDWIAPPINKLGEDESLKRLAIYIYTKKKLMNVPTIQNPIYECKDFALFHGEGKNNDLNNTCFMLKLNNTLLPGDCEFNYWPEKFGIKTSDKNYKYKNLVFPHHGANMEDEKNNIDCLENSNKTKVIVPTGYNGYCHPRDNIHILGGKNYSIFPTNPIDRNKYSAVTSVFSNYFSIGNNARCDKVNNPKNWKFSIEDLKR